MESERSKYTETTITAQNWWRHLIAGVVGLILTVVGFRTGIYFILVEQAVVIIMLGFFALRGQPLNKLLNRKRNGRWWGTAAAWTASALALLGFPALLLYLFAAAT